MVETVATAPAPPIPAPPVPAEVVAPPQPQTPEELYEALDEDTRAELIDGEIITMPPATIRHSRTSDRLLRLMSFFAEARGLGEVFGTAGMHLGEQRYVPDVAFVASAHAERVQETHIAGAADLVVEVLSPSTAGRDWGSKMRDYEQYGVPEYWLLNPVVEQINVYVLDDAGKYQPLAPDADGRYHSQVLPGFFVERGWLWPGDGQTADTLAALRALALL